MSGVQSWPVCAICCGGPSRDRTLLQCSSKICTDGPWFHSDCLGSAITSRNLNKTQSWLCPWCVLKQSAPSASLSERQLLALTLQISRLDSFRSKSSSSAEERRSCSKKITRSGIHPSVDVGVRSDPLRHSVSSSINGCSSNDTATPPPPLNSSTSSSKRSRTTICDPSNLRFSPDDRFGSCAKCRRAYPLCLVFCCDAFRDTHFHTALRLPSGMRHPKRVHSDIGTSSSSLHGSDALKPEVQHDAESIQSPATSCASSSAASATPSHLRTARASFRRNSSSLLAEFDSSAFKFSSSLSFKNPSAFSRCWRQGRSQMHGWGLFASEFIPAGQRITEYVLFYPALARQHFLFVAIDALVHLFSDTLGSCCGLASVT